MKRAILSVTNDLYTDPRVDKVALFLTRNHYQVTLVGRCYGDSPTLAPRLYRTKRLRLLFRRGSLFYAEYSFRLFCYLLFQKTDLLIANDLDTLLPNFLVSKMHRKSLVYDSHEYFCGEWSVVNNPHAYKVWHTIEKYCFPKLKKVITVSQSIVNQYEKEYGIRPFLVRNIPPAAVPNLTETRASLHIPENKFVLILQGNGINEGRGAEELVQSMPLLSGVHLLIVGNGTVLPQLKTMVQELKIENKVSFIGRQNQDKLFNYTALSDVGMALDKDVSANLRFSLPNKIFEYIKAGTPLVVSNLVERAAIVNQYQVGVVAESLTPQSIARAVESLQHNPERYASCKQNCAIAAHQLTWENEEKILEKIYLS